MNEDDKHEYEALFIRQLEKFRIDKGVSQREMSLSLGQSAGYIAKLTSGHNLPRMITFFWICDYFNIHPRDFFNEEIIGNPVLIDSINKGLYKLSNEQLKYILALVTDLSKK
ncbi:helix-turn-helix transcriptional regulator [Anaerocolumna aminovalerica]|jgi:transcriptional regulator with XRE-family HTH domain|uniref:Helix-turn-helix domain-containing protein n=1 Tax=Anaerocolumna aminovalerica TaxID=1527 RepID=A0A1I5CYA8_9FIRM|nr:helix-turn-helix transcriptional regulator [Anaerocolumna aminovalerica]MBU5331295.1 helix-turn-helix transcriptional regulator [Anaerocolumna aminovalerica]MDU6264365.1 helix-turn-helix transcriptional regulator [Anaerocolumna aminovalerica]SFN91938.1 Helix-turn-helix domain-containing protein [Anaerocolumna aminovalerica]